MRLDPSLLWTWPRAIDRAPYLLTGALLFSVKFALDWAVATWGFGRPWSPLNYLIWPNDRTLRVLDLGDPERGFALTMLLLSLPFIWTGVILTLHRLYAAGLPRGLVVLFFVPLVNLLLFAVLVVLPSREPLPALAAPHLPDRRTEALRLAHRRLVRESHWRSGLVALLVTVPLAVLAVVLGAQLLHSYGFSLFVGAPFALGLFSVLVYGFSWPKPFGACLLVALAATALAGLAVLAVALEGLICLLMAAPIAAALALAGAVVGYVIQSRPWLGDQMASVVLAVLLTLPALMAAEAAAAPEPELRAVRTQLVIDAPPEAVWDKVVSFPPLAEPDDWLFRCGIAYPQRAEIRGQGPGAVRHCVFSTGTFVEPIDVWEAPARLRFRVTAQPEPLREWSPYRIHPPHLDNFLVSRQGQFLLEALPGGRTRLEGTTWFTNRMWPAAYWGAWSDAIIHRIHGRVLTHIRDLAEGGTGR
jgi:hypothetical protein